MEKKMFIEFSYYLKKSFTERSDSKHEKQTEILLLSQIWACVPFSFGWMVSKYSKKTRLDSILDCNPLLLG